MLHFWRSLCQSEHIDTALIYLRFSNIITVKDDGRLAFNFRNRCDRPVSVSISQIRVSQRISTDRVGCFDWSKDTRDATLPSGTASGSDQATNVSSALVGKHLKHVARRLMWYPIRKLDGSNFTYAYSLISLGTHFSVYSSGCTRVRVSDERSCRVEAAFRPASLCRNLFWRQWYVISWN